MNTSTPAAGQRSRGATGRPGVAVVAICLVQLMVVLDVTVVNVALPSVRSELGTSVAAAQWVVTAYALAFGGLLLLGGRAGDILGRKRVFVVGILAFTVASLLAGLVTEPWQLICARVAQGVGAAAASPTALAIIATTINDPRLRGRAMALYAAMSGLGAALGLVLGGTITEWLSWRWTFLINVPVGAIAAVLALLAVPTTRGRAGRFDLAGAMAATLGACSLVYGCSIVAERGGLPGTAIGAIALGIFGLALFAWLERGRPHAMLPVRLVLNGDRGTAYAAMAVVGACLFSLLYFTSGLLQDDLEFGPLSAGVAFVPFSAAMVTMSQLSARHAQGARAWLWVSSGLLLAGVALAWLAVGDPYQSYAAEILGPLVVAGVGLGAAFVPLTLLGIVDVGHHDAGVASGVVDSMQQLGGALGIAALAALAVDRGLVAEAGEIGGLPVDHSVAFAIASAMTTIAALVTSRRVWGR